MNYSRYKLWYLAVHNEISIRRLYLCERCNKFKYVCEYNVHNDWRHIRAKWCFINTNRIFLIYLRHWISNIWAESLWCSEHSIPWIGNGTFCLKDCEVYNIYQGGEGKQDWTARHWTCKCKHVIHTFITLQMKEYITLTTTGKWHTH